MIHRPRHDSLLCSDLTPQTGPLRDRGEAGERLQRIGYFVTFWTLIELVPLLNLRGPADTSQGLYNVVIYLVWNLLAAKVVLTL